MAKQTINVGSTANDGTGDKLRDAFVKVNANFTELYSDDLGDVNSIIAGTGISVSSATGDVTVTNSAPDQTVSLTEGTGIDITGTYPNFTIASTVSGIDGTGTANYIPKWTDGDTIGNSVIYDDGTNIGIGTNSPSSKLQSYVISTGNVGATAAASLSLASDGAINTFNTITFGKQPSNSYAPAYVGYITTDATGSSKGDIIFGARNVTTDSAPTERMRITSTGMVQVASGVDLSFAVPTVGAVKIGRIDRAYIQIERNDFDGDISFVTTGTGDAGLLERMRIHDTGDISFRDGSANEGFYWDRSAASLGIGTTTPSQKLSVVSGGSLTRANITNTDNGALGAGIQFTVESGGSLVSNATIRVDNAGNVSIFNGINNSEVEHIRITSGGDLHVDGDVIAFSTTISDQRLKDNIQTIDNALDKVSNLRGVSYTWNNGNRKGQKDLGLIAQEVEQVLPELVREKEMPMIDGGTYKTVDYEKIVGVLIEAVKELKAEVESLKSK